MGSSTEQLRLATDAEKRARDHVTHPAWGQRLSLDAWLEREAVLRAHPFSAGSMETWLWLDGAGRVLSSCETFRNDARLGEVRGDVYAVASVFTEEPLRGKGYAARMLDAVCATLAGRSAALGSVLFSDVGASLYERIGYRAVDAFDVTLRPAPGDPAQGVEPLRAPLESPAPLPAPPGALVLHPSAAQLDWHLERERFYARVLRRPGAAFHGARRGDALALWVAGLKADELLVLWLKPGKPGDTRAVLASAQRVAHAAGLRRVRLWEAERVSGLPPGARREPRDGELPMLRAFRGSIETWVGIARALWV